MVTWRDRYMKVKSNSSKSSACEIDFMQEVSVIAMFKI